MIIDQGERLAYEPGLVSFDPCGLARLGQVGARKAPGDHEDRGESRNLVNVPH